MRLSSRFILDNLFLLAAAFLVVASMTWSAGVSRLDPRSACRPPLPSSPVPAPYSTTGAPASSATAWSPWSPCGRWSTREGRPPAGRARRNHRRAARRRLILLQTGPRAYPRGARSFLWRRMLYIAAILANVVSDGHGEHVERNRGPSRLLAGQEAVSAARYRDHGRRRDAGTI